MDFLSRYFAQIRNQIVALTISQRLLIGALVVIMLGTTFFVVFLSRQPDMVEVLPQALTPEEVAKMADYLKVHGYTYKVSGDKVMVPLETVQQVRGELAGAQVFPRDTTAAFTKILQDSNFLQSDRQHDRLYVIGLQGLLADLIGHFEYIREATVVIDKGDRATLGRDDTPSSAMVTVKLKGEDALTSAQIAAIADTVSGAVAGLKRETVHIIDGNRSYTVADSNLAMASTAIEHKILSERQYTDKLHEIFSDIPNIKIVVNVTADWSRKTLQSTTPDGKGKVIMPLEETSHETTTSDGPTGGGEPGLKPNTAASVTGGSGGSRSSSTSSDVTTKNQVVVPMTSTTQEFMPGVEIKNLSASIVVPRTYLVALHRRAVKDEKADPDDAAITKIFNTLKEQIQPLAKDAISANEVAIGWFDDVIVQSSILVGPQGGSNSFGSGITVMLTQYGKQAILGAVAVGALGMMLMMVRRAAPGVAGGGELTADVLTGGIGKNRRNHSDPGALDVDDGVIGEAGAGEAVLTGIELDDETLASRKIVDEVSIMIKENPENAASLVKRWMTKGK